MRRRRRIRRRRRDVYAMPLISFEYAPRQYAAATYDAASRHAAR